jgi:hypothetical protein
MSDRSPVGSRWSDGRTSAVATGPCSSGGGLQQPPGLCGVIVHIPTEFARAEPGAGPTRWMSETPAPQPKGGSRSPDDPRPHPCKLPTISATPPNVDRRQHRDPGVLPRCRDSPSGGGEQPGRQDPGLGERGRPDPAVLSERRLIPPLPCGDLLGRGGSSFPADGCPTAVPMNLSLMTSGVGHEAGQVAALAGLSCDWMDRRLNSRREVQQDGCEDRVADPAPEAALRSKTEYPPRDGDDTHDLDHH